MVLRNVAECLKFCAADRDYSFAWQALFDPVYNTVVCAHTLVLLPPHVDNTLGGGASLYSKNTCQRLDVGFVRALATWWDISVGCSNTRQYPDSKDSPFQMNLWVKFRDRVNQASSRTIQYVSKLVFIFFCCSFWCGYLRLVSVSWILTTASIYGWYNWADIRVSSSSITETHSHTTMANTDKLKNKTVHTVTPTNLEKSYRVGPYRLLSNKSVYVRLESHSSSGYDTPARYSDMHCSKKCFRIFYWNLQCLWCSFILVISDQWSYM